MVHEPLTWIMVSLFFGVPWCVNAVVWLHWARESCEDGTLPWRRRALALGIGANSATLLTWTAAVLAAVYYPIFDPWGWPAKVAIALLAVSVILVFVGDGKESRWLLMLAIVVTFLLLGASVPAFL